MIGGKMIGHRPISTSQHHPGAQRRQLRTGAIEAEQGQRGHGGRKPGKGMNLATSPQNECENRRRRPSRGLAHTPGTPIFALFRWTSERAASIRCPDGGSGQGSFASFLKGPLPPSGHRIERGTIDLQSTSPQNECENRRRRPSRGLAHTPGTPIFALFRWTSERAASIRCPDGGSGQGSFASFLKGPLPPSGHRIERGTIDLQSDINCLPERSLLGAFGKQHDDYDHDVFNSAGSTLATPHFGPENGVHLRPSTP